MSISLFDSFSKNTKISDARARAGFQVSSLKFCTLGIGVAIDSQFSTLYSVFETCCSGFGIRYSITLPPTPSLHIRRGRNEKCRIFVARSSVFVASLLGLPLTAPGGLNAAHLFGFLF